MKYLIAAYPASEPVTLADAKMHIRAITGDATEDAAIIAPLITAAREYCENITGMALGEQTIEAYPEAFSAVMPLPKGPVISVTKIEYAGKDENPVIMPASDYSADAIRDRVLIKSIPAVAATVNPIKITYTAGGSVPMLLRQAMLLLIGHWYTNREAVAVGAFATVEIKMAVDTMLNQYKRWWY